MALIEIPNVYNSGTAVSPGRGRFAVIGEPIVAVDLINTAAAPGSPAGDDLLSTDRGAEAWWRIERAPVPPGDLPETRALRRLRSALRDMIGSLVDDRPVLKASVSELNFFMRSAPASTRLSLTAAGLCAETHWHWEFGGNPRLAFIATQAAAFLSDPSQVRRLRRCANPACSMIFIAVNPGGHGAYPAFAATEFASPGITVAQAGSEGAPGGPRSGMRESGRPRRFRSATKRRSRSSCGAATMTTTSRSSGGPGT